MVAATLVVAVWLLLADAGTAWARVKRDIHVNLTATWQATSLLHEAAEWFGDADGNPNDFFRFAEAVVDAADGGSFDTAESFDAFCWQKINGVMDAMVDGQLRQVAKAGLASRQYSPRLEMFRQLSTESDPGACCWAVVNGEYVIQHPLQVAIELEKIESAGLMGNGSERILDVDHLYHDVDLGRNPGGASGRVVTLYGPLDSSCSIDMHRAIVDIVGSGANVTYLWRPIPLRQGRCGNVASCSALGAGGDLTIPGYGVELALKSTEYSAMDDGNAEELSLTDGRTDASDGKHHAEGTNIERLRIRTDSFKDIGKHVVEKVSTSNDPLGTILSISEDFPSMADTIADATITRDTEEAVMKLSSMVVPDAKLLMINGAGLNTKDMNFYGIIQKIRSESEFLKIVHDIGIQPEAVPSLIATRAKGGTSGTDFRLNYRPADNQIFWLSDVEQDPIFANLPATLEEMLETDFMGQRQMIRRNVFTGIIFVDMSTRSGAAAISTAVGLIKQGFPVKLGVVPVGNPDEELTSAFVRTALESGGRSAAAAFAFAASRVPQIGWEDENLFSAGMLKALASDSRVSPAQSSGTASNVASFLEQSAGALDAHLGMEVGEGIFLMNGALHTADSPSMWGSLILEAWRSEGEVVSTLVEEGGLKDDSTDLLGDILSSFGSISKLNRRIIRVPNVLGIDGLVEEPHIDVNFFDAPALLDALQDGIEYIHNSDLDLPITHWLLVNGKNSSLIDEALKATKSGRLTSSRIGVVLPGSKFVEMLDLDSDDGATGVLTNGRFLKNRFEGDVTADDFLLLEQVAAKELFADEGLMDLVLQHGGAGRASDVAAILSSILVRFRSEGGQAPPQALTLFERSPEKMKTTLPSKFGFSTAPLQVRALFDPLSSAAQQLAPILSFVHHHFHAHIEIVLNVNTEYSDMPLKSYYRYVTPVIDDLGAVTSPGAVIPRLPLQDILTLGMDVPEAWLVSPTFCKHDLDNIKLASLQEEDLVASFRLDSVLFTGMCIDAQQMRHPRGVQLELINSHGDKFTDTLVMSNLGYFQLKANPGMWELRLAEGPSKDIYTIQEVRELGMEGHRRSKSKHQIGLDTSAAVASFAGENVLLLLSPNKGSEGRDVLESIKVENSASENSSVIHVFTVASGHMYERLQKIMIMSAVKRSSRKIKFWFISNSISPQHREFIPIMADQYGFDFEFVTYKWPTWLHKQSEKQRIIWAYKILFLDVLFPLGLKKVIFCDSDQVIRADLAELWDLDLEGAPYGYTPFCDSNKEMDGFRFWKQGFWEEHLQGKPYHISALYVVDLERFRAMAAGDQLRIIYDRLSKDPNSLSNLDQDLPNFAQHDIPIKSLPQEWLWCETWCGNNTRTAAKTIDLCNNPLTKEPKLQSARRIIAEWPALNEEVTEFTARAEGYLNGSMTEGELADEGYRVHLEPMKEGIVGEQEEGQEHEQKNGAQDRKTPDSPHSEL
jgi:UDP-glucose:glycoprotein glucosyltransferase